MRLSIALFATILLACSSEDPSAGMGSALTGSVGVLQVERTALSSSPTEAGNRTILRAAFARYQGIEGQQVLRLLGSRSAAEVGGCALAATSDQLGVEAANVELIDVGELHIAVADTEAHLTPRTFPDLASVLAGVFYAGDAPLAMPQPDVDEYTLDAAGSESVGPFEVVVPAPADPAGLQLVGADGTSAALVEGSAPVVQRSGALTLQWDAGDPGDWMEIEVAAGGATLSCLGRDEGSFRISAAALASLSADSSARMSVRRVRLAPFDAPGMDAAYARIAAVRTLPLTLR